jgi:hypothetical protein
MGKRDDERIARLAKQNAAKEVKPKADRAVRYDDTLRAKPGEEDLETRRLFKDMKKREF